MADRLQDTLVVLEDDDFREVAPVRLDSGTVAERVVIGPSGVFVITTADGRGRARIRGRRLRVGDHDRQDEVTRVRAAADALRTQLWRSGARLDVTPVLVLTEARARRLRLADTIVTTPDDVAAVLRGERSLELSDIDRCLRLIARRPAPALAL